MDKKGRKVKPKLRERVVPALDTRVRIFDDELATYINHEAVMNGGWSWSRQIVHMLRIAANLEAKG